MFGFLVPAFLLDVALQRSVSRAYLVLLFVAALLLNAETMVTFVQWVAKTHFG